MVIDGFPRNVLQAKLLAKLLEKLNQPIQAVVLFEIIDELIDREDKSCLYIISLPTYLDNGTKILI